MLKICVKVLRVSVFPNHVMDSFHGWYDDRYLSEMLYSIMPPHFEDLKGNVMDLESLCWN